MPGACNCGTSTFTFSHWSVVWFSFLIVCILTQRFMILPFFFSPLNVLSVLYSLFIFYLFPFSLHFFLFTLCLCMCVCVDHSAHFGQNQLTEKSLYNPCSYEPCKCKLKNDVCGVTRLLGFPKYSGQIVFARHYEKHYPSL